MSSKSISYGGVLGFGWSVVTSNLLFFLGVAAVSTLISAPGQILAEVMKRYPGRIPFPIVLASLPVVLIVQAILGIGIIKITLSFCDGQKPRFSTLFNVWDCFFRYVGAGLLYILIIGGAMTACTLPFALLTDVRSAPCLAISITIVISILALILSIKFSLCFYFVIDKGLGPIKALKASSMATDGAKLSLFVFGIVCGLINILGALCFLVGLFVTTPIIMVAMALVYRNLSEQTPELAELGIGGPSVKPRVGTEVSSQSIGGMQFASVIQSVINARPDQSCQSRVGTRPFGGPQPASNVQSNSAIEADGTIRLSQGIQISSTAQPGPSTQPGQGVPAGDGLRAAPAVQQAGAKKKNSTLIFWIIALIIVSVTLAAGVVYRFWPTVKEKIGLSSNEEAVSKKELAITGILYSEDKPSAIIEGKIVKEGDTINGIKIVKINKDGIELEKDGIKWTQQRAK